MFFFLILSCTAKNVGNNKFHVIQTIQLDTAANLFVAFIQCKVRQRIFSSLFHLNIENKRYQQTVHGKNYEIINENVNL